MGVHYEFRHDQLRGYLAARWAAKCSVDAVSLLDGAESIWSLSRSDQSVVWNFFGDLVSPEDGIRVLNWSREAVGRDELQVVLNSIAKRDGWFVVQGDGSPYDP